MHVFVIWGECPSKPILCLRKKMFVIIMIDGGGETEMLFFILIINSRRWLVLSPTYRIRTTLPTTPCSTLPALLRLWWRTPSRLSSKLCELEILWFQPPAGRILFQNNAFTFVQESSMWSFSSSVSISFVKIKPCRSIWYFQMKTECKNYCQCKILNWI